MNKVFLGLGSNLGNKIENLKSVVRFFFWDDRFKDVEISKFYLSSPYGIKDQDDFINGAISFNTKVSLDALIKLTKELEKRVGRTSKGNWGPREIDIDILFYGDLVTEYEGITIPHKDLTNRDFVLVPLLDINPEIIHPGNKKMLKTFLSKLKDKYIIDEINFNIFEENSADHI